MLDRACDWLGSWGVCQWLMMRVHEIIYIMSGHIESGRQSQMTSGPDRNCSDGNHLLNLEQIIDSAES